MPNIADWLLAGPSWIRYRTRLDLLGQPGSDAEVVAERQAMLAEPAIQALLTELSGWPVRPISSHKEAGHPVHKLCFLADLGLCAGDHQVDGIATRVLEQQSPEGPLQVLMNISPSYGGTGQDQWAWALCDAPLLVYALHRLGWGDDPRLQAAAGHLVGLVRDSGWPCAVSRELGKWRGPGRKDDPCPYATLAMLKVLALTEEWRTSQAARIGVETLLTLWTQSRERHPYMFYMGTDFRKLKAPTIWYDIVHLLDVLTRFPWARADARLQEMLSLAQSKADPEGRYIPESVWTAWKDWEFAQKKAPSRWLTLLIEGAAGRMGPP